MSTLYMMKANNLYTLSDEGELYLRGSLPKQVRADVMIASDVCTFLIKLTRRAISTNLLFERGRPMYAHLLYEKGRALSAPFREDDS
jgi:hypothetical protein